MQITYPLALLSSLKNKYLVLDTNLFIDSASGPLGYAKFFNELKTADVTLATIDLVKYEFLKGTASSGIYKEREKHVEDIIDTIVPIVAETYKLTYELIKEYGKDGGAPGVTDLILGALIKQYKGHVYVMTRDTSDFLQRIFKLEGIINGTHAKGIFTYGVYGFL